MGGGGGCYLIQGSEDGLSKQTTERNVRFSGLRGAETMYAASGTRGAERSTAWVIIPAITVILGERC